MNRLTVGFALIGVLLGFACQDRDRPAKEPAKSNEVAKPEMWRSRQLPSERRQWTLIDCESAPSFEGVKKGDRVCVRGAAAWTHIGAEMCDGRVEVATPGLPNTFAAELLGHVQRDLEGTCPKCIAKSLRDGGRGRLDVCIEVLEVVTRAGRQVMRGDARANDDVALTHVDELEYYYVEPSSVGPMREGVLKDADVRAMWTHESAPEKP